MSDNLSIIVLITSVCVSYTDEINMAFLLFGFICISGNNSINSSTASVVDVKTNKSIRPKNSLLLNNPTLIYLKISAALFSAKNLFDIHRYSI